MYRYFKTVPLFPRGTGAYLAGVLGPGVGVSFLGTVR